MITRRKLLAGGALFSTLGIYSHQRGLRYPRLSFEHAAIENTFSSDNVSMSLKDCIAITNDDLRAIAPEPSVLVRVMTSPVSFEIRNLAKNAVLEFDFKQAGYIDEEIDGTRRVIHLNLETGQEVALKWIVPVGDGFEFAVTGDTGGGSELEWSLKRAQDLGAQFLLHLGDFNYSEGEYDQAIQHFNSAELPVYVTIGNHDFHDNGLIYGKFLKQIGPMNHAFELAGTRFINVDTAADFWPSHSGHRGALFDSLRAGAPFNNAQVLFTHRPLKDPRPHDDHEIGGIGAIDWLANECRELGIKTFLNGHVHHSAELDFQGLQQLTIGEGLGHEDLVLQKQVAKLMIGKVEPHKALEYRWEDLNMPWSIHQSPTHLFKLERDGRSQQIEWYKSLLK
jgi:hypothetical protein